MSGDNSWRSIISLAAPVVISKLSFTAMGLVDTAMVGRLGVAQQGAMGLATTYMFTLFVFGLGLLGVINTLVSQNHGAGRPMECGHVLGQGLRLGFLCGAVTMALLLASAPLFSRVGLSEQVATYGYEYLFFRVLGVPGVFGYWAYNAYMEGLGHTRTPMIITVLANLLNILLDLVLIFGLGPVPALGVAGAGMATAMSNGFMLLCFLWVVHRPGSRYREFGSRSVAPSRLDWAAQRKMVRIGLPMGFQFFLEVGAYLVISIMIGWLGDDALAANQVAVRLMSISFMSMWGVSVAATTLVGRHQGDGQADLAAQAGRRSLVMGFLCTLGFALLFVAIPDLLVELFTPFPQVARIARPLLYLAAAYQIFDGINMVSYGALRGAGDTRWPMWAVVLASWGVGIPAVYLLSISAGLGIMGAWTGMMLMITLEAWLLLSRFQSGRWRNIRVLDPHVG